MVDHPQERIPRQGGRTDPQEALLQLSRLRLDELSLGEVLHRVAELAQATVPGADEVSVTLIEGEQARSVAFTGDIAAGLDERQYTKGFGPCMDAALAGQTILLPDLAEDERYRDFSRAALRVGVHASLSVGMPVPQRTVGGLNLYSSTSGAFDQESVEVARSYADHAAVAMINASIVDSRGTLARQLEQAMASRATIEQAKGLLIGRLGCTAEEAFARLSRWSQNANRKLADVAADVVRDAQHGGGGPRPRA